MQPKVKKTPKQKQKSFAAKARKEAVRMEKEQKYRKEIEDQQWVEHDKLVLRKQKRQQSKQAKRSAQLARKAQNKLILDSELNEVSQNEKKLIEIETNEVLEDIDNESEEYLKQKLLNNKIVRERPELFVNLNRYQPTEPLVDEK
jgi:hypothetical protein